MRFSITLLGMNMATAMEDCALSKCFGWESRHFRLSDLKFMYSLVSEREMIRNFRNGKTPRLDA